MAAYAHVISWDINKEWLTDEQPTSSSAGSHVAVVGNYKWSAKVVLAAVSAPPEGYGAAIFTKGTNITHSGNAVVSKLTDKADPKGGMATYEVELLGNGALTSNNNGYDGDPFHAIGAVSGGIGFAWTPA
jgi:hypothetical protein